MLRAVLIAVAALGQADKPEKKVAPQLDKDVLQKVARAEELKRDAVDTLVKKRASKKAIDAARAADYLPEVTLPFAAGTIGGRKGFDEISVLKVVDDDNFVGEIRLRRPGGISIVDKGNGGADIKIERKEATTETQTAWFKGFATQKLAEKSLYDLSGLWIVSGTKPYEPVNGSAQQVIVIEPLDLAPYYAELRKKKSAGPTADAKAPKADKSDETPEQKAAREEKAAAGKLRSAETLLKQGKREAYRSVLKDLAEKYPETEAGKKAAKLLK